MPKPTVHSAGHVPVLDGLRGIAILMVLGHHYSIVWSRTIPLESGIRSVLEFGWCGVDLFFALSGFLITGILIDAKGQESYFPRFYWRRLVRIFPLYYVFLAAVFVLLPFFPGIGVTTAQVAPWWYLTYLQNWKPNRGASDPFLGHTWSLAVEEQFYGVWPLIVRFSSTKVLTWVCVAGALAAFAV